MYEPPERRPFGRAEEAFQLRGRHAGGLILSELKEQKTIPEPWNKWKGVNTQDVNGIKAWKAEMEREKSDLPSEEDDPVVDGEIQTP